MIEIKHILCPIDFSAHSRHGFDHAAAIARWYSARVTVLHVIPPIAALVPSVGAPLYPPLVYTAEDLEQYRTAVDAFVRDESASGIPIETAAVEGGPAGTIVEWAETLPADLIVIGTHGRSGFERLMLGSVTERVLRKSPCPVLTVPTHAPDVVPTGPILYKSILCALDFSPSSTRALKYAASLAMEADARLTVMHVVEAHAEVLEPVITTGSGLPPLDEAARESARRHLREAIGDEVRTFSHVNEVVATGKPYREILRTAKAEGSDLIVMGVHGGVAGALAFGSTTNHIVREAACPVLTLRA